MEKIGIVGLGMVGGSLAKALEEHYQLLLWDRDEKTRKALKGKAVLEPELLAPQVDCLLLAVPPRETPALMASTLASGAPLVISTSSFQEEAFSSFKDLDLKEQHFFGLDPLLYIPQRGWDQSRSALVKNLPWALVANNPDRDALLKVFEILSCLRGAALPIAPEEHDKALALTSHSVQILQLAIAAMLADQPAYYNRLSSHLLEEITTGAEADLDLYQDIAALNAENADAALESIENEIRSAREGLRSPRVLWRHGRYGREGLLRSRWTEWRSRSLPWASFWSGMLELGQRGALLRNPEDRGPLLYIESSL